VLVNSLAIAVDLGISFVGLAVSIILFYSIKLATKPADLIHNYGYGKVEHVCETLEGVILIGIALAMSSQAVMEMFHPTGIHKPWVGLFSCAVNTSINFGGAYYIFKMAKKSSSPAIYAEGVHWKMEGFISGMIAVSFVISIFLRARGIEKAALYVDPITALLVSILVIIPSFALAKSSFFKLLDASVEEPSQMEILKQINRHINDFCEFKDLRTRTAGRDKFIEFKVVVPEDISFKRGHDIVSQLEKDIQAAVPNCEVTIRMEPCVKDCEFGRKGQKCPYL
jgi:cation diffusion facilitator family transporter